MNMKFYQWVWESQMSLIEESAAFLTGILSRELESNKQTNKMTIIPEGKYRLK